ncbi:MAG: biopolymer transporter ExbD [Proteobacteria bacterium]|nr:biopolymer transporter ExbD [Pseudomonadota bacterium]
MNIGEFGIGGAQTLTAVGGDIWSLSIVLPASIAGGSKRLDVDAVASSGDLSSASFVLPLNKPPQISQLEPIADGRKGNVAIRFVVSDAEAELVDIEFEVSTDGGATFSAFTPSFVSGESALGLISARTGRAQTLHWQSRADGFASTGEQSYSLRLRPIDANGFSGDRQTTSTFTLNNDWTTPAADASLPTEFVGAHLKQFGVTLNLVSLMDIFTILVFFLLVNSSEVETLPNTKDLQLPESIAEKKANETVVILISEEHIIVQGTVVANVADVMATRGNDIPELREALQSQNDRVLRRAAQEEIIGREVTIMGDKDIPYRLLKKVMATCMASDYGRISLAVLQKSSDKLGGIQAAR